MRVNDEAKFDIQGLGGPEVASVDIVKPNKERLALNSKDYSCLKGLRMLSIKAQYFTEAGEYTAVFLFDGANDTEVVFTVEE